MNKMLQASTLITIPNLLSIIRGFLGPVVMWLITFDAWAALITALILMIVAEISDFVDGIIARNFNQETQLGRIIDPVCDSIYHLSVFLGFLYMGWMPAWMLFVIYARDLIVPYIRALARQNGQEIHVRNSGKIKTATHAFAQVGVVALALDVSTTFQNPSLDISRMLLLTATCASVYSLIDYVWAVVSKLPKD